MRVAVIGCGAIAQKAHLPALKTIPNVDVRYVVDVSDIRARRAAERFKVPNYSVDYEDVLEDPTVDMVILCTPSQLHATMAAEAAKANKHVLVEKPLSLTTKEALVAVRVAKDHGIKLGVVMNYRYFPSIVNAKRRISSNYLGRITSLQGIGHITPSVGRMSSRWLFHGGGALDDFGPHVIDMILWLSNMKVREVAAFGGDFLGSMNCINAIQILMRGNDNVVASADISWLTGSRLFRLDVHGTAGHIFANVFYDHVREVHGSLDPLDEFKDSMSRIRSMARYVMSGRYFVGAFSVYPALLSDFVNAVEGNSEVSSPGKEAVDVVMVSEAAKISLREGRVVEMEELLSGL